VVWLREETLSVKHEVQAVGSLQEFFQGAVKTAMAQHGLEASELTAYYVVNMLTLFARSDELFDEDAGRFGVRPIALMLADAQDAPRPDLRNFTLQRIGDVSLFIAGFFSDSLARRIVDVDYYVRMGGSAYGSLAQYVRGSVRGRAFGSVFAELAQKFQDFVDVLNEVREQAGNQGAPDILRLYEIWLRTGSARAERKLRKAGIEPNRRLDVDTRH
jgi:hypothetical protein